MSVDHSQFAEPVQPGQVVRSKRPGQAQQGAAAGGFGVTTEQVGARWLVLHVTGELDMVTAPTLAAEVARLLGPEGSVGDRTLVFDLTGTSFLASSGLAVLADAAREVARRSLPKARVVAADRPVRRPIEVTGLDTVLAMYADLAAALESPADD